MQSQQRDPLVQALLAFIVPFYILYWLYIAAKDMEQRFGQKAPSLWWLFSPMVLTVVYITGFLALITTSIAVDNSGAASGLGVLLAIAALIFFPLVLILPFVYYWQFSGNAERVIGPDASRILLIILFMFLSPAVTFIVQDKLNTLTQQPNNPGQPYPNQPLQSPVVGQGPQNTPPQA